MSTTKQGMKQKMLAVLLLMAVLVSAFGGLVPQANVQNTLTSPVMAHAANDFWDVEIVDGTLKVGGNALGATPAEGSGAVNMEEGFNRVKTLIMMFTGFCALLSGAFLIFAITKLGASGGDPSKRSKAITAIICSGVGLALLGSSTLIIGFFWNAMVGI
jgi:hypothetical protein